MVLVGLVMFCSAPTAGKRLPANTVLSLLSTCVTLGTGANCQLLAWTCCLLSCPHSVPQHTFPLMDDCAPLTETSFGLGW